MTRPVLLILVAGIVLLYVYHYSATVRQWLRALVRWFSSPQEDREIRIAQRRPAEHAAAQAEIERFEAYVKEVTLLTVEQAKRRAAPILCVPALWHCEGGAPNEPGRLPDLGPTLRELFTQCATVEALHGEINLRRGEIAPAPAPATDALRFSNEGPKRIRRFYRIGMDLDGNPVIVEPGEDTIHVVHRATATQGAEWTTTYPSVYHWLLVKHFAMQRREKHDG